MHDIVSVPPDDETVDHGFSSVRRNTLDRRFVLFPNALRHEFGQRVEAQIRAENTGHLALGVRHLAGIGTEDRTGSDIVKVRIGPDPFGRLQAHRVPFGAEVVMGLGADVPDGDPVRPVQGVGLKPTALFAVIIRHESHRTAIEVAVGLQLVLDCRNDQVGRVKMPGQLIDDIVCGDFHPAHRRGHVPLGLVQEVENVRPGKKQQPGGGDQENEHRDKGHHGQHREHDAPGQAAGKRFHLLHSSDIGIMVYWQ